MTRALPWAQAREAARSAAGPLPPVTRPLAQCLDHLLSGSLVALTDLPPFDTAAMDGWAVAGSGPWKVHGRVLAGGHGEPLADGEAAEVATGAQLPPGATAVLRREHGTLDGTILWGEVEPGGDVRPRGQECRIGDRLLSPATRVTPAVLGLAAAAGYDELPVIDRPAVDALVVGDELLHRGPPREGRVRDALGPLLPDWLTRIGARTCRVRHAPDQLHALSDAVAESDAQVVVTTGGTARGPVDHLHELLARLGAEPVVDGVRVRPGHPMLLARLDHGRFLVGLPGNPLAAVSGVVTLLAPLLATLGGEPALPPTRVRLADPVTGHPSDTRLVPIHDGVPLHYTGPAMLRGLAHADGLAVIPPGGAAAGDHVERLPIP